MEQNITFPYDGADLDERKWYDWEWWKRALYMVWVPWIFVFIMWFGQETIVRLVGLWAWIGTWSWDPGDVFVYAMIIVALAPIMIVLAAIQVGE